MSSLCVCVGLWGRLSPVISPVLYVSILFQPNLLASLVPRTGGVVWCGDCLCSPPSTLLALWGFWVSSSLSLSLSLTFLLEHKIHPAQGGGGNGFTHSPPTLSHHWGDASTEKTERNRESVSEGRVPQRDALKVSGWSGHDPGFLSSFLGSLDVVTAPGDKYRWQRHSVAP